MLTINRSGSYFFINGEISPEIVESLHNVTSYYVQNYEKTDKFQRGEWDGKERLLRRAKNGSYYFPFGLIDNVRDALSIWGVIYQVRDANGQTTVDEIGDATDELRPYQVKALNQLVTRCYNCSGVLALPTGAGKCHGKGTKILMFDGSIKNVEDIKVGEQLMGPDSKPRNVLSLARGIDEMFLISPVKGDSWTCNKSHVLSLKITSDESPYKKDQIINIPLDEYISKTKWFKHISKQWRIGVEFEKQSTYIDPYIIGLWLGDGTKKYPCITNSDPEIIKEIEEFAESNNLDILRVPGNNTTMHNFSSPIRGCPGMNTLRNAIKDCVINDEKRIPREYLINDEYNRLQLLSGLLDSDGYYQHCGYEIITKYEGLKDDILFLVRSLGLAAYSSVKIGRIKSSGFEGKYHRITINGFTNIIPCKVARKQAEKRRQKKNVLKMGFKVIPQGIGEYYGFELDGDGLYLLGDFTVTHNTRCALYWAKLLNKPFIVLVHRVELLRQWRDEIERYFGYSPSIIGAGEDKEGDSRATVAMIQTISERIKKDKDWKIDTGLLVIDECHTCPAKTFYEVSMRIDAQYRLGLSATTTRTDGAELKIFAACGKVAAVVSVEDLVSDGYLTLPVFRMEQLPPVRIPYSASWATIYKQGIVLNMERNDKIRDIAEEYLNAGRQVYIHVNQIDHGKCLTGMIGGATFVCGSTKKDDREDIINRFKAGEIRCLVSTLLKEGVSIDGISCLIYASGGKSEVSLIQTIGRALRVDPLFGDAIVVDFLDRGHRILENHVQDRISAYRENYGELFGY